MDKLRPGRYLDQYGDVNTKYEDGTWEVWSLGEVSPKVLIGRNAPINTEEIRDLDATQQKWKYLDDENGQ